MTGSEALKAGKSQRLCWAATVAVYLALGILAGHPSTAAACQSDADRALICSIADAFIINAQALQRGDVLFRCVQITDGINRKLGFNPDGLIEEIETLTRLAFDYENNSYCQLEISVTRLTDLTRADRGEPVQSETISRRGVFVRPDCTGMMREFPGETVAIRRYNARETPEMQRFRLGIHDARAFGYSLMRGDSLPSAISEMDNIRGGSNLVQTVRNRDCIEMFFSKVWDPDHPPSESSWTFDVVRSLPVASRGLSRSEEGNLRPYSGIDFEWQEVAGVWVGKSARSFMGADIVSEGRTVVGMRDSELQMHWFSVNEELPPEALDGSRFREIETFQQFLYPEKAGATSLIKKDEQR